MSQPTIEKVAGNLVCDAISIMIEAAKALRDGTAAICPKCGLVVTTRVPGTDMWRCGDCYEEFDKGAQP